MAQHPDFKTLNDIVQRAQPLVPWVEGDNIPWDDPDFSERMLREHLSQEHDLASRRATLVDGHVDWIVREVLGGEPLPTLDLACGPGLYAERLARRGSPCTGLDFSPASIRHAQQAAASAGLPCTYRLADVRTADYGADYGLAMMLYGQLNVFRRSEARSMLARAHAALRPGGRLLLEPQTYQQVHADGASTSSWYSAPGGLFSDGAHLVLQESAWDEERRTRTDRFFVVHAQTAAVERYAMSAVAYEDRELEALLGDLGFGDVTFYPSLLGRPDAEHPYNLVVVARR